MAFHSRPGTQPRFKRTPSFRLRSESQTQVLISNMAGCRGHLGMLRLRYLLECILLSGRKELLRIDASEDLNELGDHTGPTGLMAGAQARAVVTVEVLVEEQEVLP